ncbi:hypothetical protein TNCV_3732001 [Trichonephila clavipes]|nr:hypothetical protein TNCV_3732001 [Trichonephila clavipes]
MAFSSPNNAKCDIENSPDIKHPILEMSLGKQGTLFTPPLPKNKEKKRKSVECFYEVKKQIPGEGEKGCVEKHSSVQCFADQRKPRPLCLELKYEG